MTVLKALKVEAEAEAAAQANKPADVSAGEAVEEDEVSIAADFTNC